MKKALLIVAGVGVAAIVAAVGVIAAQPDTMPVQRELVIDAAPADIWVHISDVRAQQAWSPWNAKDPNLTLEYSEVTSGPGAWYSWTGNSDVGSGKMTLRTATEPTVVVSDLHFITPFESDAVVTYSVVESDGKSTMTWAMDAENAFISKAFSLVMDMDAMIGPDFEQGLAKLAPLAVATRDARIAAEQAAAEQAAAQQAAEQAAAEAANAGALPI